MSKPSSEQDAIHGAAQPAGVYTASRRIAFNTAARAVGEILAKAANVVLFIAIARELGESTFGDFIFALSLSLVVLGMAGFGTNELIAREVARDRSVVHSTLANVLVIKALLMFVFTGLVVLIVHLGDYPPETELATALIAAGVAIEILTQSIQAVFLAHEKMAYISVVLVVQRVVTAAIGIAVMLSGGTLVAVSAVIAGGALFGLLIAAVLLRARVVRIRFTVQRERWIPLLRAGFPIGVVTLLFTALLKLDAAMLGFLADDGSVAVGQYGAAYRLVEATMFISTAIGAAMLPWLSRAREDGALPLGRGYELGLKATAAVLLPIGLIYGLFADPLIHLFYGDAFDGAIGPLRLLAAMTVLFGINGYIAFALIARNRPGDFTRPAAVVLVQNAVFNFILIPVYGAKGAAFNAVLSGLLLAIASLRAGAKAATPSSAVRALAAPLAAGVAMCLVILVAGTTLAAAIAGVVVFAGSFFALERVLYPEDFGLYAGLARSVKDRRGARGAPPTPPELGGIGP